MDLENFGNELALALAREFLLREQEFASYSMRALDLGIFPWHGLIEPSFLTSADNCTEREIANWTHYNFARAKRGFGPGGWPDVAELETWMLGFYEGDRGSHANALFAAAASALKSHEVQRALAGYRKTDDFRLTVFDPDDSHSKNYVDD